MFLTNLKESNHIDIKEYFIKNFPDITPYQREKLDDFIFDMPYEIFEEKKKTINKWIRLSIIIFPIVWLIVSIGLPFNYILTGKWGYDMKNIKWFKDWSNMLKLI